MSATIQPAGTGSLTVASGSAGVYPVGFGYYPPEGSRVVTAQYQWTQTGYTEDLSGIVARGVETSIQGAYIDNSTNDQAVTITVLGVGQVILCAPFSQGTYPLLFAGFPSLSLSVASATGFTTRIYYLNVPVGPSVWFPTQPLTGSPGTAILTNTETISPMYITSGFFSMVVTATDAFTLYGSATKIVRIHEIFVASNATNVLQVVKRATQNTGGTSAPLNMVPIDSANANATATALAYSVNPTSLGTTIGQLMVLPYIVGDGLVRMGRYGATDQSVVLRGVNEGIAIGVAGGGGAAAGLAVSVKWQEI